MQGEDQIESDGMIIEEGRMLGREIEKIRWYTDPVVAFATRCHVTYVGTLGS